MRGSVRQNYAGENIATADSANAFRQVAPLELALSLARPYNER